MHACKIIFNCVIITAIYSYNVKIEFQHAHMLKYYVYILAHYGMLT